MAVVSSQAKRALGLVLAAFVLRLLAIGYLAHLKPSLLTWGVNEAGGIARWIITRHSFSAPFHDASGPTAWLGPVYPAIVAVFLAIFGVGSVNSAVGAMVFNAACSALTTLVVYMIALHLGGTRSAMMSGALWAFSPYVLVMPTVLWDTALSALVLSYLVLKSMQPSSTDMDAASWGAVWGFAGLMNPSLLSPFPFLLALRGLRQNRWRSVFISLTAALAIVAPWAVRNYARFHRLYPIRSNGSAEIYFANVGYESHPLGSSMEYQNLGEAEFISRYGRLAWKYIAEHPRQFLLDSLARAFEFWANPPSLWPLTMLIDVSGLGFLAILAWSDDSAPIPLLYNIDGLPADLLRLIGVFAVSTSG